MRVDGVQTDKSMRPLSSFLFRCYLSRNPDNSLSELTDSVLKKLNYSVRAVTVPKMAEQGQDTIEFGSFAMTFPFFSTGKRETTMTFYETDDMLVSRVFYAIQQRKRWKSSSLFREQDADLIADIEIFDQRNTFDLPAKTPIYTQRMYLKLVKVNSPDFKRTSTVTLLETSIEFNAMIEPYSGSYASSPVDAIGEMKSAAEGGLDREPEAAFIDADQMLQTFRTSLEEFSDWFYDKPKADNLASSSDRISSDRESKNPQLRAYAESLGANSQSRQAALSGSDSEFRINDLREQLKAEGVNTKDYQEVASALVEMGILGNYGGPNGWCQRGTSILEAVVSEKPRVTAQTASRSVSAWEDAGYEVSESRRVKTVTEINKQLENLIKEGKLKPGDKIVIDYDDKPRTGSYDSSKEEAGHISTYLGKVDGIDRTVSDRMQLSLAGLSAKHRVTGYKILTRNRQDLADQALLKVSSPGSWSATELDPAPVYSSAEEKRDNGRAKLRVKE